MSNIEPVDAHPSAENSVWGDGNGVRAFLSHKAEVKAEAAQIKKQPGYWGISAFLAHEDITPAREWMTEIKQALHTMDLMLALLTKGSRKSEWTNQEVGYALGQGVQVIPINLDSLPYGFIGSYQAVN